MTLFNGKMLTCVCRVDSGICKPVSTYVGGGNFYETY